MDDCQIVLLNKKKLEMALSGVNIEKLRMFQTIYEEPKES